MELPAPIERALHVPTHTYTYAYTQTKHTYTNYYTGRTYWHVNGDSHTRPSPQTTCEGSHVWMNEPDDPR